MIEGGIRRNIFSKIDIGTHQVTIAKRCRRVNIPVLRLHRGLLRIHWHDVLILGLDLLLVRCMVNL